MEIGMRLGQTDGQAMMVIAGRGHPYSIYGTVTDRHGDDGTLGRMRTMGGIRTARTMRAAAQLRA